MIIYRLVKLVQTSGKKVESVHHSLVLGLLLDKTDWWRVVDKKEAIVWKQLLSQQQTYGCTTHRMPKLLSLYDFKVQHFVNLWIWPQDPKY